MAMLAVAQDCEGGSLRHTKPPCAQVAALLAPRKALLAPQAMRSWRASEASLAPHMSTVSATTALLVGQCLDFTALYRTLTRPCAVATPAAAAAAESPSSAAAPVRHPQRQPGCCPRRHQRQPSCCHRRHQRAATDMTGKAIYVLGVTVMIGKATYLPGVTVVGGEAIYLLVVTVGAGQSIYLMGVTAMVGKSIRHGQQSNVFCLCPWPSTFGM